MTVKKISCYCLLKKRTVCVDVVSTSPEFRSSGKIPWAMDRKESWVIAGEIYEYSVKTIQFKLPKQNFVFASLQA
jgi:hypothetical protein